MNFLPYSSVYSFLVRTVHFIKILLLFIIQYQGKKARKKTGRMGISEQVSAMHRRVGAQHHPAHVFSSPGCVRNLRLDNPCVRLV